MERPRTGVVGSLAPATTRTGQERPAEHLLTPAAATSSPQQTEPRGVEPNCRECPKHALMVAIRNPASGGGTGGLRKNAESVAELPAESPKMS